MDLYFYIMIGAVFYAVAIAEHRRHQSNFDFLVFASGELIKSRELEWFYHIYHVLFAIGLVRFVLPSDYPPAMQTTLGLSILFASSLLRYSAIQTLGRQWTKRLIFVPSFPRVRRGPYAWLSHPEYLARIAEGVGICLLFDSWLLLWGFLFSSIFLCYRFIPIENGQLQSLAAEESLYPLR